MLNTTLRLVLDGATNNVVEDTAFWKRTARLIFLRTALLMAISIHGCERMCRSSEKFCVLETDCTMCGSMLLPPPYTKKIIY